MEEFKLPDLASLTREDVQEEFSRLYERYKQMREQSEEDAQRIYELKRSLDTALAAEAYLTQELEQVTASCNCAQVDEHNRTQSIEVDELRRKVSKLSEEYAAMQQEYEALHEDHEQLKKKMQAVLLASKAESEAISSTTPSEEWLQRFHQMECENMELLQKLEEFQENDVHYIQKLAEKEKNIEVLRDQLICLEENLHSKREELEEKTQILESTQEQLAEANAKIAMLTTTPDNSGRKGNSLFAEVDDQRQVMKQLLAAQKKSYMQMKKVFNESEYEIRRLKRENIAMHTELQACSTIFCNADKTYQQKLNERIRLLHAQNEELERKLDWTQARLKDVASDKGVMWLDSMLSFCKQETDDLKKLLHSVRIQKASLEEQLRSAQQDMARWRFESLKSRCVLFDRENLLTEHNIKFKPIKDLEFNITEAQTEKARPRIVSHAATAENTKTKKIKEEAAKGTEEVKEQNIVGEFNPEKNFQGAGEANMVLDSTLEMKEPSPQAQNIGKIDSNETEVSPVQSRTPQPVEGALEDENNKENIPSRDVICLDNSVRDQSSNLLSKLTLHSPPPTLRERSQPTIRVKSFASESELLHSKFSPHQDSMPGPSILCKKRDFLAFNKVKNVNFSARSPIVHNLSACNASDTNDSIGGGVCDEEIKAEAEAACIDSSGGGYGSTTIKQMRTKSNVVVRRVIIGPKKEPK